MRSKNKETNTTAYTAATTLIIGLGAILEKLKEIGFDKLYADTAKRAESTKRSS